MSANKGISGKAPAVTKTKVIKSGKLTPVRGGSTKMFSRQSVKAAKAL